MLHVHVTCRSAGRARLLGCIRLFNGTAHLAFSRGSLKSFCSLLLLSGLAKLTPFLFPLPSACLSCCSRVQVSNIYSRHPSQRAQGPLAINWGHPSSLSISSLAVLPYPSTCLPCHDIQLLGTGCLRLSAPLHPSSDVLAPHATIEEKPSRPKNVPSC